PEPFKTHPANVKIWDNKEKRWVTLGQDSTAIARHELFGPEIAFGHALSKAYPSHRICIIKTAAGGTKLHTQWQPGMVMYRRLILNMNNALRDLEASNTPCDIAGMLWMQGESDSETTEMAHAYEANLRSLIADVRTQTKNASLPFVMGRISSSLLKETPWNFDQARIVQAAQEAAAAQDAHTYIINTDDLSTL
ncbi:MAG: sialate O-acetylesterase, partial [Planctomycetes bacterium]|nr:sialate O-acetylesterase [Planctomycetota bacterium]